MQAQFSPSFWQLFSGSRAGAALANFLAAVFRRLCRRSSHQFSGSCSPEAAQAQLSPIIWQLFPKAMQAHLSPIFWQLCSGDCAGAARQFSGSCFQRRCRRSSDQFSGGCFPEAVQAQLSPIFWQLFTEGCAGAALTNFQTAVSGDRAGAALTNFLAAVFRMLCRRSSHQFSGSCFPEAVQAQLSPIFWQLFPGDCAGAALTNFLAAVFRRRRA